MGHFPQAFIERLLQEFDASVAAGISRPAVEEAGRFAGRALERERANSQEAALLMDDTDEEVS
jgi:hypothetical protein